MKFRNVAWLLTAALVLQAREDPPRKANEIQVGGLLYAFHLDKVEVGSTTGNYKKSQRLFRLNGHLVPTSGNAILLELTAYENGHIYTLKMTRHQTVGPSEDAFAATLKTKVEVLQFHPEPGGSLRLRLSGPLAATLKDGGAMTTWNGEILASLDGVGQ